MILAFLNPRTFLKTPPTCVQSGPWILWPPGSHRITQDQSLMILACLNPQTFTKTLPTCVWSGPGIQEPPGPVLYDPCLLNPHTFSKNLLPVSGLVLGF